MDHWSFAMDVEDSYLMMLSRSTLNEKTSDHPGTCKHNINFATEQKQKRTTNAQVPMISPIVEHAVSYEPHWGCNYSWWQNADATSCWQCKSFRVHNADCFLCIPPLVMLHRENVDTIERKKKCTIRSAKWKESALKIMRTKASKFDGSNEWTAVQLKAWNCANRTLKKEC